MPAAAAYGFTAGDRLANLRALAAFVKAERASLGFAKGETVDADWKKENTMALLEYLFRIMQDLNERNSGDSHRLRPGVDFGRCSTRAVTRRYSVAMWSRLLLRGTMVCHGLALTEAPVPPVRGNNNAEDGG